MSFDKKVTESIIERSAAHSPLFPPQPSQPPAFFSHALGSRQVQQLRQDSEQTLSGLKRTGKEIHNPSLQKRIKSEAASGPSIPIAHISKKFESQILREFENSEGIQEIHLNWTKPHHKKTGLPIPPKFEDHPQIAELPDPKDVETSRIIDRDTDIYDSEKRLILGYRTGFDFGNADFFRSLFNLSQLNLVRGPAAGKVSEQFQNPQKPWLKKVRENKKTAPYGNSHYSTKFGGFPPIGKSAIQQKTNNCSNLDQQARICLAPLCQKVAQVMKHSWPMIHAIHQQHIEAFNKQTDSFPQQEQSWFQNHFSQVPEACYSAVVCNLHKIGPTDRVLKNSQAAYHFDNAKTHNLKTYEGLIYYSENTEGGDLHLNELGLTIRATNDCFLLFKGTLFSHGVTNIKQKESLQDAYRFSCSFMGVPVSAKPPLKAKRAPIQFNQTIPEKHFLEGISEIKFQHALKKDSLLPCLNEESSLKTYAPCLAYSNLFFITFTLASQKEKVTENDLLQRVNVISHQFDEKIVKIVQESVCNIKDFVDQGSLKVELSYNKSIVKAVIKGSTTRASTLQRELFSLYVGNHRLLDRAFIASLKDAKMPSSYEAICQHIQNTFNGALPQLIAAQKKEGGYKTLEEFGQIQEKTVAYQTSTT